MLLEDKMLCTFRIYYSLNKFLSTDLENFKALQNSEKMLIKIGNSIKKIVPFEAEMPSEVITPPMVGDQSDCNKVNTLHVDEFLYDEMEVNDLVKKGKLKRRYCRDCTSRNVQVSFI